MSRVSIVEDHERLADVVRRALVAAGIGALMRRPAALTALVVSHADIMVDPQQRALRCTTHSVPLAPAELQILLSADQRSRPDGTAFGLWSMPLGGWARQ